MKTRDLCIYLDSIRAGKKISREEFIFEVISLRQFNRYLHGEAEIPHHILVKLSNKLDMKSLHILSNFEKTKKLETDRINLFFKDIVNYDYKSAAMFIKNTDVDKIIESRNKVYYRHGVIMYNFHTKKTSSVQTAHLNASLINYPKILSYEYLDFIDLLILSSLLDLSSFENQEKIIEKIYQVINNNEKLVDGNNNFTYPYILVKLSKVYGMRDNLDKVIELCDKGIKRSYRTRNYYLLEYFYYYTALSHYKLGDIEKCYDNVFYCYTVLNLSRDINKFKKFDDLIKEDFNIRYREFMMRYSEKEFPYQNKKTAN